MERTTDLRLCGGTFLTLLLLVRNQRTSIRGRFESESDNLSEPNVFTGLIKVVKPDYISFENQNNELRKKSKSNFKTITSNYKHCKSSKSSANIPFLTTPVVDVFNRPVRQLKDMLKCNKVKKNECI